MPDSSVKFQPVTSSTTLFPSLETLRPPLVPIGAVAEKSRIPPFGIAPPTSELGSAEHVLKRFSLQAVRVAVMASVDLQVAFGRVIRDLRLKAGLSQEALSLICGRHRTYVSLIEGGKNSPSITTLWLMAEALEVQPSLVIRRVEKALAT